MSDMFPDIPSVSPQAAWMDEHQVETHKFRLPEKYPGMPWVCRHRPVRGMTYNLVGLGHTEQQATIDYAEKQGIRHWLFERE